MAGGRVGDRGGQRGSEGGRETERARARETEGGRGEGICLVMRAGEPTGRARKDLLPAPMLPRRVSICCKISTTCVCARACARG